ncbi:MAG: Na+/H+ antiporter subunit E, partial [Bacteriovoracaceae bacterium]
MENRNTNFSDLKLTRLLIHAGLLFVGWLVLSGLYDVFHLLLGVLSVAIVIFLNRQSYFPVEGERPAKSFNLVRILFFHLWMFKEMVMSAVFVVRCVFSSS